MSTLFANRAALVDLAAGSASVLPLPAGATDADRPLADFLGDHFPDALIFAVGPLTGSFAPASCLLAARMPEQNPDQIPDQIPGQSGNRLIALKGRSGPALRFCGLDALIITGRAASPCAVCVNEKGVRLLPVPPDQTLPALRACLLSPLSASQGLPAGNLWDNEAQDNELRDSEAALLLPGPAAFCKSQVEPDCLELGLDLGLAPGTGTLAAAMAACGLAAVRLDGGLAFRSPLPLDNPARSAVSPQRVTAQNLPELLKAAAQGETVNKTEKSLPADALSALGKILGRSLACSACPSPCGFWLPTGESHVACTDPGALASLLAAGATPERAADLLALGERFGLNPAALAGFAKVPDLPEDLDACLTGLSAVPRLSAAATPLAALGLKLGICPFFLTRHPKVDEAALLSCLKGLKVLAGPCDKGAEPQQGRG